MNGRCMVGTLALGVSLYSATAESLIQNGDFENGNTNFISSYTYSPGDIFDSATYDVSRNPRDSHPSASFYRDHTSNTGLMMVANGSMTTPNLVWSQSVNVQTGTLYKFELWASSWYNSPPGQLAVYVEGVEIGPRVTAPTATSVWTNFHWLWTSGAQSPVLFEIRNTSFAEAGNDFALDDISLVPALKGDDVAISPAVEVWWNSTTNLLYQVEWSHDLQSNTWTSLGVPVIGNGNTNSVFDSCRSLQQRFYRVRLLQ